MVNTNAVNPVRFLPQIYHAGLLHIDMKLIIGKLALPVIIALGLALALPYLSVAAVAPFFGATFETQTLMLRRIYPFLLFASTVIYFCYWQINKFKLICLHIKNDKYLVGKRLVNYDGNREQRSHHSPLQLN